MNVAGLLESYDWEHAFAHFPAERREVTEVIASDEGDNEGPEWLGIFRLHNGLFLAARAWRDCTDWDYRSGGIGSLHSTREEAECVGLTLKERTRLGL